MRTKIARARTIFPPGRPFSALFRRSDGTKKFSRLPVGRNAASGARVRRSCAPCRRKFRLIHRSSASLRRVRERIEARTDPDRGNHAEEHARKPAAGRQLFGERRIHDCIAEKAAKPQSRGGQHRHKPCDRQLQPDDPGIDSRAPADGAAPDAPRPERSKARRRSARPPAEPSARQRSTSGPRARQTESPPHRSAGSRRRIPAAKNPIHP